MEVHAAYDELWEIERLRPNPRNPNKHPAKQIELLAKIIKEQGWRAPITVSMRSGFIVRGHARLEAAKLLKCEKVPVDLQYYKSEAMEMADLIADNKIAELAEKDMMGIKDILEEIDTGAFDIEITGFDEKEIEKLMTQFHIEPSVIEENENGAAIIECPNCGFRWEKKK